MRYLITVLLLLCLVPAFGCEEEYTYQSLPSQETITITETITVQPNTTTIYSTITETVYLPENTSQAAVSTFDSIIFTGSGGEKTAPFFIPTEEWIIEWSFTSGSDSAMMSIFVYPRGETIAYVESILFANEQQGSTYSYAGPGEYYLDIIAVNIENWTITIKPPQ